MTAAPPNPSSILAGRRIAFVHDFFGPGEAPIGGSGRVLQIIAHGCLEAGAEPSVLVDRYSRSAPSIDRWERDGLPVYQFPLLRSIPESCHFFGKTRWRQWLAARAVPRALAAVSPELVHIHVDFPNGLLRFGLECKRRAGARVIVTSHGLEGFEQMGARFDRATLKPDWIEAVESVDAWVPCGPADHTELVRWGIPESKITPIHNGVVVPDALPPRALPALTHRIDLVYVGNITGTKGVFDLAAALVRFTELAPGIRPNLQLVGNASADVQRILRETLEPQRDRLDYSITGYLGTEQIEELFHSADLFCYPSRRREGIPMAILEAAAHGCPMVVSDAPGHMGVLTPDVHAIVFRQRDVPGLAGALVRAAKDAALRATIRNNAYEHVKTMYNRQRMVEGYLALYARWLAR